MRLITVAVGAPAIRSECFVDALAAKGSAPA